MILDRGDLELIRGHALHNAYAYGGKAQPAAVIGRVLADRPELKPTIKELSKAVVKASIQVNRLSREEQLLELQKRHPRLLQERLEKNKIRTLPPLPNAVEGSVVTRFPPEPNGYPHIGHAKAAIIDETYARMYKGRFILRFDDTNPTQEKEEYYQGIREGLEWLGLKPDVVKNTSDDLEKIYEYAKKLIEKDGAYVCTCRISEIRADRAEGVTCSCRANDTSKTMHDWEKMFKEFRPNEAILRLRGDMKHPNTVMRDPTLFRILEHNHPLKGDKYRVWPTYDFSVVVEDYIDGITHAMRTKEYELRDELYFTIVNLLGLRKPELIEFARLDMQGSPVSKRKLRPLVDKGLVQGWDDPRLSTLSALRRKGFTPEAIRKFILEMGVTKTESTPTWDILESLNRKILDSKVRRYFFANDPIRLEVKGAPKRVVKLRNHPQMDLGERAVETSGSYWVPSEDMTGLEEGDVLRLIELYNVKVERKSDGVVEGSYSGTELIDKSLRIQWVTSHNIKLKVLVASPPLIGEDFNPRSLVTISGLGEKAIGELPRGSIVQLVRFGFCRIDSPGTAIFAHR